MERDAAAITFGTDGWRATLSEFTTPRVRMVGQAVATFLNDRAVSGPVAVGYDARDTSRGFAEELARVLAANGRDVTIADRDCPTPTLAWTVATGEFVGGLMVTASHNPPEYNGVKYVTGDGAPALPDVTDELQERLASPSTAAEYGTITEADVLGPYVDGVQEFVDRQVGGLDLDGMRVAYDAMHGSGRGVTDTALSEVGATVVRVRCDRDPDFGGVPPEPGPETAGEVIERVRAGEADIGFVNDGDADRVGIVTPERGYLDPNLVLAALYEFLLEEASGSVVRTVSTSSLVDRVARAAGEDVHETAVGFKWIAAAMAAHETLAGGEESGGYGVTDHLRNKDGILSALLACAAASEQPLDARLDALLAEYGGIQQGRQSVNCPDRAKAGVLDAVDGALSETFAGVDVERVTTVDGFKIQLEDGTWVLVRPSGTEPKLRIYAEADEESRVEELLDAGQNLLEPLISESV